MLNPIEASGSDPNNFASQLQGGRVGRGHAFGDTTPCRMTGATLRSHVRYKESFHTGLYPQDAS